MFMLYTYLSIYLSIGISVCVCVCVSLKGRTLSLRRVCGVRVSVCSLCIPFPPPRDVLAASVVAAFECCCDALTFPFLPFNKSRGRPRLSCAFVR